MAYVHPILGFITVLLLSVAALLGLRARHPRPYAKRSRRVHARLAPAVYVLALVTAVVGGVSTGWLRDDLPFGSTWHFRAGLAAVVLLTGGALASRWIPRHRRAGIVHLLCGLGALGAMLLLAVLGMDLLP